MAGRIETALGCFAPFGASARGAWSQIAPVVAICRTSGSHPAAPLAHIKKKGPVGRLNRGRVSGCRGRTDRNSFWLFRPLRGFGAWRLVSNRSCGRSLSNLRLSPGSAVGAYKEKGPHQGPFFFISVMVPVAGLEPARPQRQRILNPSCLPISPHWHKRACYYKRLFPQVNAIHLRSGCAESR